MWLGPTVCRHARKLIGEVHPDFIRTGGENAVHVSRFARLTECTTAPPPPPVAPRSEETEVAAQVICVLVANEIVRDRCTLQIGIGDVSAALALFLGERHAKSPGAAVFADAVRDPRAGGGGDFGSDEGVEALIVIPGRAKREL